MGKHSLQSPIIEISSKDNVTTEITQLIHKLDYANANGLDFIKNYTEINMNSLINKPVVCRYYDDEDDLGTHEQEVDEDGNIIKLNTIAIGTFKEVWIDEYEDGEALFAKADLWSYKYPEIVTCVKKLHSEGNASSSVEVEIYEYDGEPTKEYRAAKDYTYLSNCLLGSTVAPADSDAGVISVAQLEVAQAIKNDLSNIKNNEKGDDLVAETQEFNRGYETKSFVTEIASLKFSEISSQIYNMLNPVNVKSGDREYCYYIREIYNDYAIVEDWNSYEVLYKIPYEVANEQIILAPKESWEKGYLGFVSEGSSTFELQSQIKELSEQIEKTKEEAELLMSKTVEELQTELATKETEMSTLSAKIEELEAKVTELNETVVNQETSKVSLEGTIAGLNAQIEELLPFKEQVETAEKEAKTAELAEKYEKLLSEETFKSEEVQSAIQELNAQKLNEIVVNEVASGKNVVVTEVNTKKDIMVNAKQAEQLLKDDILTKYGIK